MHLQNVKPVLIILLALATSDSFARVELAEGVYIPDKLALGLSAEQIYITDELGMRLIQTSHYKADFFRLSTTLVTQQTQSMCAVASSVTVLNALLPRKDKPQAPIYYPYPYYTQESFFTDSVNDVVSMQAVFEQGMTLKQIEDSLRRNNVNAERVHASASTVEAFRKILKDDFISTESYIIVNFARKGVGQKGGGHFSPIAAYHEKTDRVLILDVARYKYAPAWVRLDSLFNAMNTVDDASKKGRGWVRISRVEK